MVLIKYLIIIRRAISAFDMFIASVAFIFYYWEMMAIDFGDYRFKRR